MTPFDHCVIIRQCVSPKRLKRVSRKQLLLKWAILVSRIFAGIKFSIKEWMTKYYFTFLYYQHAAIIVYVNRV